VSARVVELPRREVDADHASVRKCARHRNRHPARTAADVEYGALRSEQWL
jgi:hypothetical protein